MSSYRPSHPFDSDTDHRGVLSIVSWFLAIASTLVVCARLGTRWVVTRTFEPDDGMIVAGLCFAIAQTGALTGAVENGLGLIQDDFSSTQLENQQKYIYTFNILFIVSQVLVKSSLVVFIRVLTPVTSHRRLCIALLVAIAAWGVASVLGLIFQCGPSVVWKFVDSQCIDRLAFYTAIEAVNGMLDLALVAIPVIITWALHLRRDRKIIIVGTFTARILVVAAIATQIVVLHWPNTGPDAFLTWYFALSTQLVEYLSIISANGPYLRPFLESLSSGMIGNGDIRRRTGSGTQVPSKLSDFLGARRMHSATGGSLARSPTTPRKPSFGRDGGQFALNPLRFHAKAGGRLDPVKDSAEVDAEEWGHGIQHTRTFSVRSGTLSQAA